MRGKPRTASMSLALLSATTVCAVVPAAGLAGWIVMQEQARWSVTVPSTQVMDNAAAGAEALNRWFTEALDDLRSWSRIPALVEGVRKAALEHLERGYTEEPPQWVDTHLVHEGHLHLATPADEYLEVQLQAADERWRQLQYTDEYGFIVGRVGVDDDFVQTDEAWWKRAWAQGAFDGMVQVDEVTGEPGIRVARRIEDPATDSAVGVVDALLGVEGVQAVSDRLARDGTMHVRVLDADGQLVAETQSGHAKDRILKLTAQEMREEGWLDGVGRSATAGGRREGDTERAWRRLDATEGPHQGWIVLVERQVEPPPPTLGGIEVLGASWLVVASASLSWMWLRSRVTRRLQRLLSATEQMSQGNVRANVPTTGRDEIARIGIGLELMRRTIQHALRLLSLRRTDEGGRSRPVEPPASPPPPEKTDGGSAR